MSRFTNLLAKSGPKIALAAMVGGAVLLIAAQLDRGRDLQSPPDKTEAAPAAAPATPAPTPALAAPVLKERSRHDPVHVDPNAMVVRRVLPITKPFRHGDFMWDEAGAPATGRLIVTVDLKAQTMSVFRAGYEIGAAVIIYGATDKESPLGAFPITEKDADHVSNLYDAPMPYMLRLTNDGVAIHASDVKWGAATHGCIGVPMEFARKLFAIAKLGDLVVITDGKMLDTTHARADG
ncbi:MAG: L,D-transpeptidase family protein [Sphingobium sp.]